MVRSLVKFWKGPTEVLEGSLVKFWKGPARAMLKTAASHSHLTTTAHRVSA